MSNVRLALVNEFGTVETVIEAPAGSDANFPADVLGLPGNWVVDSFVEAGPGSLFDIESGEFAPPDMPEESE